MARAIRTSGDNGDVSSSGGGHTRSERYLYGMCVREGEVATALKAVWSSRGRAPFRVFPILQPEQRKKIRSEGRVHHISYERRGRASLSRKEKGRFERL